MFPSFISPPSVGYQRVGFSERGSLDRAGCGGHGVEFDDGCPEDSPIRAAERGDDERSKRICRKTDRAILSILVWVYFLQILDKTVLGYSAIFGLQEDMNLRDNQYSVLGSAPIAQLAWQPFSFMLIVKVPQRILMPALVLGWGIAQAFTPACHSFAELLVNRFFLGLFEAGVPAALA
ncbi:hypothetical protein QBC46DRAFT_358938 [Diplogelasinospora grovesii]|uniref:Major facilitator superfamily (MFS) profile domain-containing protein n=1 Tax=Diplogelasinospora grovesii TaxID=303347 RepID=A0AAN6RZ67_9PEZI|nr:hypothetical protein QBC46DRAFT_358938 [Diplogelasinospora grovesii]